MIRAYSGEYLVSPIPIHLGLNWCTHNCAYCFANLNNPDRRANYSVINQFVKNYLDPSWSGKDLSTSFARAGHPVLASNDSDPFAVSNTEQAASIIDGMIDAGIPLSFQTRGGKHAAKVLTRHRPTMVYISFTTDKESVRASCEPGAPTYEERKELAMFCKAAGHHVVIGLNPFEPEWWIDFDGFLRWCVENSLMHWWTGVGHLNYKQVAAMRPSQKHAMGQAIELWTKKSRTDQAVLFAAYMKECEGAGVHIFENVSSKRGGFWEPYYALGFPFTPTLDGLFKELKTYGESVAFTFEYFNDWSAFSDLRSSGWKEYVQNFGRSIRNLGHDEKAYTQTQANEKIWAIDKYPTGLRHDDIYIAAQGDSMAVDEENRPVLVYAPGLKNDTGRIQLEDCSAFIT